MEAWFARAWLLATMAREGVSRLSGTRALTWQQFSESFPDAKGWFFRLVAFRCQYKSLHSYLKDFNFTARPEFFSAFACLLLGKGMQVNPAWLQDNRVQLMAFSKAYRTKHKVDCAPARVVRAVRDGYSPSDP